MIRFTIAPGIENEIEKELLKTKGADPSDIVFGTASPRQYRKLRASGCSVFGLIPDPALPHPAGACAEIADDTCPSGACAEIVDDTWPSGACLMEEDAETEDDYLRLVRARCMEIPYVTAVGERIYLREFWENDSKDMSWLTGTDSERILQIASYRNYVYLPWSIGIWGIFSKEDHTLLGRAGLEYDREGEVTLGYEVLPPYRRKGFALEALLLALQTFRKMDPDYASLRPVVVNISPENLPSLSLIKKAEKYSPLPLEIRLVQVDSDGSSNK